ncbi:MAG: hypothetical protein CMH53_06950, partial [Myxococcales bacterium]|nr:hypothetical protein [Myxococcales bacterium]
MQNVNGKLTHHAGILKIIKRLPNTTSGNPRYEVELDGYRMVTKPDVSDAYLVSDLGGCPVGVLAGYHYGKLSISQIFPGTERSHPEDARRWKESI